MVFGKARERRPRGAERLVGGPTSRAAVGVAETWSIATVDASIFRPTLVAIRLVPLENCRADAMNRYS